MRVLLDTNVVLDLYLDRMPFADDAERLWLAHEQGHLTAYVSAITPVNIFYIARRLKDQKTAYQALAELLAVIPICSLHATVLMDGLQLNFSDYEDAVQHACATAAGLEAIITRNTADFAQATLPIYSPDDFLKAFSHLWNTELGDG